MCHYGLPCGRPVDAPRVLAIRKLGGYSLTNLVQAGQLTSIHAGLATSQLCIHMLYMWISDMQSGQEPFHLKRKQLKFQVSVPAQDSTQNRFRINLDAYPWPEYGPYPFLNAMVKTRHESL